MKCVYCDKEFEPKRKEQKYCSHPCSVKGNKRVYNFGTVDYVRKGFYEQK